MNLATRARSSGATRRPKSALIPLLHLAQEQDGYVTNDAMAPHRRAGRRHPGRGVRHGDVLRDVQVRAGRQVPDQHLRHDVVRPAGRRRADAPRRGAPRHQGRRHHPRRPVHAAARRVPGGVHRGAVPAGELPPPLPRHHRRSSTSSSTTCAAGRLDGEIPPHGTRRPRSPAHPRRPGRRRRRIPTTSPTRRRGCRPRADGGRIMTVVRGTAVSAGRPGSSTATARRSSPRASSTRTRTRSSATSPPAATRACAPRSAKSPADGHDRGQERHPARPRRRRLPGRREVGAHAAGRVAALPRRQRRRERAGHLQGPPADGARPAPAHRGLPDRVLRRRAVAVLPLRPRRDGAGPGAHRHGAERGLRRRLRRQEHPRHRLLASTSCCTGAPAPTWSARRRR